MVTFKTYSYTVDRNSFDEPFHSRASQGDDNHNGLTVEMTTPISDFDLSLDQKAVLEDLIDVAVDTEVRASRGK